MWTQQNRAQYNRDFLRYPSDATDEEWAYVAPLIPEAKRGGRKREVNVREVFNGVMYVLSRDARGVTSQGLAAQKHGLSVFLRLGL